MWGRHKMMQRSKKMMQNLIQHLRDWNSEQRDKSPWMSGCLESEGVMDIFFVFHIIWKYVDPKN